MSEFLLRQDGEPLRRRVGAQPRRQRWQAEGERLIDRVWFWPLPGLVGRRLPNLHILRALHDRKAILRDTPEERYSYEVLIGVDTGIAAGNFGVSWEGPVMRFFPTLDTLRQLASDLKAEARFVRLLEGLDVAEVDYEAARLEWPFNLFADAVDEDDWSI